VLRYLTQVPLGGLLAAAASARFAVLVGRAMVTANALLLLTSRRLRSIGQDSMTSRGAVPGGRR
jgi:hypothetical protein